MSESVLLAGILFGILLAFIGLWMLFGRMIVPWFRSIPWQNYSDSILGLAGNLHRMITMPERHTNVMMIMAALLMISPLYLIPFDRIDVNGGLGWDGYVYALGVMDFYGITNVNWVDMISRIFPPGLLHHIFVLFDIPFSNDNIILAFLISNILTITGIIYIWGLVADELKITWRGKWLGFIGLLINYLILKQYVYYPVHTDMIGYLIALVMLFYYLKYNQAALFILVVIGAFTHPTLMYIGGVLFIFPREHPKTILDESAKKTKLAALLMGILLALAAFAYIFSNLPTVSNQIFKERYAQLAPFLDVDTVLTALLPFSVMFVLTHITLGAFFLAKDSRVFYIRDYLDFRIIIRIFLIGFSTWVILYFQDHVSPFPPLDAQSLLPQLFSLALVHPGVFYIAHVLWFGPLILFIYILWPQIARTLKEYGRGMIFCAILAVFFSLISASRRIDPFYALLLPFTVKVIDQLNWSGYKYWIMAGLSGFYSRVWLIIGTVSTDWGMVKYHINRGQYMTFYAYIFFLLIVGFTGIYFYDFFLERDVFPWSSHLRELSVRLNNKTGLLLKRSNTSRILFGGLMILLAVGLYFCGNLFMDTTMKAWMSK